MNNYIPSNWITEKKWMAIHFIIPAWKNPMDKGAWQATVDRVTKSQT